MFVPEIENLAQELKSLVGRGAKYQHVLIRPTLRDLVAAKYPDLLNPTLLASAIIAELVECAGDDQVFRLMWNLDKTDWSALTRRTEICHLTGIGVEKFRRAEGPEMDLCRAFAKELWDRLA